MNMTKVDTKELVKKIHKVTPDKIEGFFEHYRFLSNFEESPIEYEGHTYVCTEGAYQASKSVHTAIKEKFVRLKGTEAKALGKKIAIRGDWDKIKVDVMLEITRIKYKHKNLAYKLLQTGSKYLEETNWWGDQYWGVCNGAGNNYLGHILMKVRKELIEKSRP
jgi:ribA/ribD-fused uncharacterized protein